MTEVIALLKDILLELKELNKNKTQIIYINQPPNQENPNIFPNVPWSPPVFPNPDGPWKSPFIVTCGQNSEVEQKSL